MVHGDKRDFPKINIFVAHHDALGRRYFAYTASTTWAKTCKEAKERFYTARYPQVTMTDIKCRFAK